MAGENSPQPGTTPVAQYDLGTGSGRMRFAAAVLTELNAEGLDSDTNGVLDERDALDVSWRPSQLTEAADWRQANQRFADISALAGQLHRLLHDCCRTDCAFSELWTEQYENLHRAARTLTDRGSCQRSALSCDRRKASSVAGPHTVSMCVEYHCGGGAFALRVAMVAP